jgi:hypothetical protein
MHLKGVASEDWVGLLPWRLRVQIIQHSRPASPGAWPSALWRSGVRSGIAGRVADLRLGARAPSSTMSPVPGSGDDVAGSEGGLRLTA